ncbi:MAG: hypothetical protein JHC88_07440 [Niveispirillum sp.]|nr:hypothetical protein [Niveispirillum sp.]
MSHISDELWTRIARSTGGGPELRNRLNEAIDVVWAETACENNRADAIRIKKELNQLMELTTDLILKMICMGHDLRSILLYESGFNCKRNKEMKGGENAQIYRPVEYFEQELLVDQLSHLSSMIFSGIGRVRIPKKGISLHTRLLRREMMIGFVDYSLHVNGCKILFRRPSAFIGWLYDLVRIVDPHCTENIVKSEIRNWVDKRDNDPDHGRTHCMLVWDQIGNQPITSYAPLIVERSCQEDFVE